MSGGRKGEAAGARNEGPILLVDDDPVTLLVLGRELEALGAQVLKSSSYDDAIRRFREATCDRAIIDLNLGTEDGLSLGQVLSSGAGDRSIIMVAFSGDDDPELRRRCRAAGFRRLVPKPATAKMLLDALSD